MLTLAKFRAQQIYTDSTLQYKQGNNQGMNFLCVSASTRMMLRAKHMNDTEENQPIKKIVHDKEQTETKATALVTELTRNT